MMGGLQQQSTDAVKVTAGRKQRQMLLITVLTAAQWPSNQQEPAPRLWLHSCRSADPRRLHLPSGPIHVFTASDEHGRVVAATVVPTQEIVKLNTGHSPETFVSASTAATADQRWLSSRFDYHYHFKAFFNTQSCLDTLTDSSGHSRVRFCLQCNTLDHIRGGWISLSVEFCIVWTMSSHIWHVTSCFIWET